MIRISQQDNAGAAKTYYSKADYYTEGEELIGSWGNKGAARLGLEGTVDKHSSERLCDNLDPKTGTQLTVRTRSERTVCYDFTFFVPKSVSLQYTLTGDQGILDAFRAAVRESMREKEAEMKTRVRTRGPIPIASARTWSGRNSSIARLGPLRASQTRNCTPTSLSSTRLGTSRNAAGRRGNPGVETRRSVLPDGIPRHVAEVTQILRQQGNYKKAVQALSEIGQEDRSTEPCLACRQNLTGLTVRAKSGTPPVFYLPVFYAISGSLFGHQGDGPAPAGADSLDFDVQAHNAETVGSRELLQVGQLFRFAAAPCRRGRLVSVRR